MSMENAIKFYSEMAKDESKLAQFADLQNKKVDEKVFNERILPIAKKMGYDFTYQELKKALSEPKVISDADLENVAGGVTNVNMFSNNNNTRFGCF